MKTAITCTRRIEFDAAHRLLQHEGKCKNLHGHSYALEATFEGSGLDALGRVVDFAVIKEKLGAWIDANWDHTVILSDKDRSLGEAVSRETGQSIFYLPANPTAEQMALYLLEQVCPKLFKDAGIACISVVLRETPNCHVEAKIA